MTPTMTLTEAIKPVAASVVAPPEEDDDDDKVLGFIPAGELPVFIGVAVFVGILLLIGVLNCAGKAGEQAADADIQEAMSVASMQEIGGATSFASMGSAMDIGL